MIGKSVTMTITVCSCNHCPHKDHDCYGDSYCNHFDVYDSYYGRKIWEQNWDAMTETCPLYKASLKNERL